MTERIESELINSNVFVVSDEKSCIIIDCGAKTEDVALAVGDKKVEAIFLTHGHYDHCFYVLDYVQKFGCKVFCSEFAKEYLENSDYNYSEGHFSLKDFSDFIFLKNSGKLQVSNFEITYFQLGGHSKGDMCFAVFDEVFVGDILIGRDMGRIDLYGGSKQEMTKSLDFLHKLSYKIMHSGHGLDNDKTTQDKVINLWLRFLKR